jgi:hypothetical protein
MYKYLKKLDKCAKNKKVSAVMRFTRKVKEIGAVIAGLLAVSLVEGDMDFGGDIANKVNTSKSANGTLGSAAGKAKTRARAKKKSEANASRTAAQSAKQGNNVSDNAAKLASKTPTNATQDRVHLTSYLKFGNGTAYATYSNGAKIRRGPPLGKFLRNSWKISRQLV